MSAIRVIQFTDPHLFGDAAGYAARRQYARDAGAHAVRRLGAPGHRGRHPRDRAISCRTTRAATSISAGCSPASANPCCACPATTTSCRRCAPRCRPALRCSTAPPTSAPGASCCSTASSPNQAGGRISIEMLTKLDEDLGRARQRHAMVCLHHHPVAMQSRWLDKRRPRQRQRILVRHRQPPAGEGGGLGPRAPGRSKARAAACACSRRRPPARSSSRAPISSSSTTSRPPIACSR